MLKNLNKRFERDQVEKTFVPGGAVFKDCRGCGGLGQVLYFFSIRVSYIIERWHFTYLPNLFIKADSH